MKKMAGIRFLAAGVLFFALITYAGEITIGTDTSTSWSCPLFTGYHDARTQTIYLASEIGGATTFDSLALDVSVKPGQTMNYFTIRLKHTDLSAYGASPVWESSGWTTVYQTNQTISTTGWTTFIFTTPFVYNGTQNLIVDISFNNSSYSSTGYCKFTSSSVNRSICYYTNSGYGDPLTWSSRTPAPNVKAGFPNIRLGFSVQMVVATPVFSPAGGTYNTEQNVIITCATPGATIRYTTDGSDPNEGLVYEPNSIIAVDHSMTLKAKAWKEGFTPSGVTSTTYQFAVVTPVFSPDGGVYNSEQTVTVTCGTAGAVIHYIASGLDPTENDPIIENGGRITVSVNPATVLKARAFKTGWTDSAVKTALYRVPQVLYVNYMATGSGDGTSWQDAYTDLAAALTHAADGDEIWVAMGTYYSPVNAFQLKNNVPVYGGFAGVETLRTQRDWKTNKTILSGNNMQRVFYHPASLQLNTSAILDGFTIADGYVYGEWILWYSWPDTKGTSGGGMLNENCSPTIRNCIFLHNSAYGIIFEPDAFSPSQETFIEQDYSGWYHFYCYVGYGGGIYNLNSNPVIDNCVFINNSAIVGGAGIENNSSSPMITNCVFYGNSADESLYSWIYPWDHYYSGCSIACGIGNNTNSFPTITNCTFAANTNEISVTNVSGSHPIVANSILWDNWPINNMGNASCTVSYSNMRNGYSGTGNINLDPKFNHVPSSNPDNTPDWDALSLQAGSPCIDAGNNSLVPQHIETDVAGAQRFFDDPNTVDTGVGIPPLVDMGAYEAMAAYETPMNRVATPVFTPYGGSYYIEYNVIITCATPGATIHYTTNGLDPTENDPVIVSGSSVFINQNLALKAKAWKNGIPPSNIRSAPYQLIVTKPDFTPKGGMYETDQTITITCSTPGAVIRYTTDGSNPIDGTIVPNGGSILITIDSLIVLQVQAFKTGWTSSSINSAEYRKNYSGGSGTANDPFLISSPIQFQILSNHSSDWDKCFKLLNNVDLANIVFSTSPIAPDINKSQAAFQGTAFTGLFDGNGYAINNLTIDSSSDCIGLFGSISSGGQICNLHFKNINIHGNGYMIGGLAGYNYGTITNCSCTGTILGNDYVGGLVGHNLGSISKSFTAGIVNGDGYVGGLAGYNNGSITNCYSSSIVGGSYDIGGLVGYLKNGNLNNCYSTGQVNGTSGIGGLLGYKYSGVVSACFWDTQTSMRSTSAGGTGKTTAEMKTLSTFTSAGWDFSIADGDPADWFMPSPPDYPRLALQRLIGQNEFMLLSQYWQMTGCTTSQPCAAADWYVDGTIDILDLDVLVECWLSGAIQKRYPIVLADYWPMDETSGTVASDSVGGHHGQTNNMAGTPWVAGKVGNCLSFDGVDDYIVVTGYKGIGGMQPRTCAAWIKPQSKNDYRMILSWGDSQNGQAWMMGLMSDGRLFLNMFGGAFVGTTNLIDGNWYHVAVVLGGDTNNDGRLWIEDFKFYIDGNPQTISVLSETPGTSLSTYGGADLTIGVRNYNNNPAGWYNKFYYKGLIDDVRIYNMPLTDAEVLDLYQNP